MLWMRFHRRLARIHRDLNPGGTPAPASASPTGSGTGPLDGIVVIDAGQAITGPLAAMMLGDMGATVIKVENPHGMGDLNRPVGPMRNGRGIYFHNFSEPLLVVTTCLSATSTHPRLRLSAMNGCLVRRRPR